MMPFGNLLNQALGAIGHQSFQYQKYATRTLQPNGQWLSTYGSPMCIQGSAQPVPRELYQDYGLDFQRHYVTFYVSANLLDVQRDISGDQIHFNGATYQCLSENNWFPQDGWKGILAVKVTA